MNDFWIQHGNTIMSLLGLVSTFVLGVLSARNKLFTDNRNSDVKLEGMYAVTSKDLLKEITQLTKDKINLTEEVVELRRQVGALQIQNQEMQSQNSDLMDKVDKLIKRLDRAELLITTTTTIK